MIIWKNFKADDSFYVIGRGHVFVVNFTKKYNVNLRDVIIVDGVRYTITGIDGPAWDSRRGIICKEIQPTNN